MKNERLHALTRQAAFGTIELVNCLPRTMAFHRLGGQLFNSGTSQAANYRAADRAQSTKALIAKLKIVEEESDESQFWLECLFVAKLPEAQHQRARDLQDMFSQITRMTIAAVRTSRARLKAERQQARSRSR
jgi:four helix bundle protein